MATNRFRSEQLRKFLETTRGKSYTVGVVSTILVLGLFVFAIFPATSAILAQVQDNDRRDLALRQIENKRSVLRSLLEIEEDNRAITVGLMQSLPDGVGQEVLVQDILDMADTSSVRLANLRFTGIEGVRSNFDEFEIGSDVLDAKVVSISVDGTKSEFERFIGLLENSRRIINIRTISVSRREQLTQGSFDPVYPFRLNVQAEIYFWNYDKLEE